MEITLQDISFEQNENGIYAKFLKYYRFELTGNYEVADGSLVLDEKDEKKAWNEIQSGLRNLTSTLNNHPAVYVDSNLGLPLIGSSYFGIVDRNTNLIEIRPNTGCNLDCIYCSVDEGKSSRKLIDFVVEKDFLVDELKHLVDAKNDKDIEVHINPQGEPTLYAPLLDLIKSIKDIEAVKRISMDTNGIMLTKGFANELKEAGLTQINISIDAVDEKIATQMSGTNYPSKKIMDLIPELDLDIVLAPIYVPGINDEEISKLVAYAKEHQLKIGIQNFLPYKSGRNPNKGIPMEKFFSFLKKLEEEHNCKLIFSEEDFNIHKTKKLECPFRKDEIVTLNAIVPGRNPKEVLASERGRTIQIKSAPRLGKMKARIIRVKHNIITAVFLK